MYLNILSWLSCWAYWTWKVSPSPTPTSSLHQTGKYVLKPTSNKPKSWMPGYHERCDKCLSQIIFPLTGDRRCVQPCFGADATFVPRARDRADTHYHILAECSLCQGPDPNFSIHLSSWAVSGCQPSVTTVIFFLIEPILWVAGLF